MAREYKKQQEIKAKEKKETEKQTDEKTNTEAKQNGTEKADETSEKEHKQNGVQDMDTDRETEKETENKQNGTKDTETETEMETETEENEDTEFGSEFVVQKEETVNLFALHSLSNALNTGTHAHTHSHSAAERLSKDIDERAIPRMETVRDLGVFCFCLYVLSTTCSWCCGLVCLPYLFVIQDLDLFIVCVLSRFVVCAEHLQLSLVEAMFLMHSLKALRVFREDGVRVSVCLS